MITVSGRASYTQEERRELIEEFHVSGMKQVEFCREWSLNPKTLARWLRQERGVSFCEVDLGASARMDEVRIYLPNRAEIVVPVATREQLGSVLLEAAGYLGSPCLIVSLSILCGAFQHDELIRRIGADEAFASVPVVGVDIVTVENQLACYLA